MANYSYSKSYNDLVIAIKEKNFNKAIELLNSTTVLKDHDGDYIVFGYCMNRYFCEDKNCFELLDNQIRKQKLSKMFPNA
jgi:hypothetical protein